MNISIAEWEWEYKTIESTKQFYGKKFILKGSNKLDTKELMKRVKSLFYSMVSKYTQYFRQIKSSFNSRFDEKNNYSSSILEILKILN